MVVNRLQKGLINSRIALSASRLNCAFFLVILIEIFIMKNKNTKKKVKKTTTIVYSQTVLFICLQYTSSEY
jgi:hypothetical protein